MNTAAFIIRYAILSLTIMLGTAFLLVLPFLIEGVGK